VATEVDGNGGDGAASARRLDKLHVMHGHSWFDNYMCIASSFKKLPEFIFEFFFGEDPGKFGLLQYVNLSENSGHLGLNDFCVVFFAFLHLQFNFFLRLCF